MSDIKERVQFPAGFHQPTVENPSQVIAPVELPDPRFFNWHYEGVILQITTRDKEEVVSVIAAEVKQTRNLKTLTPFPMMHAGNQLWLHADTISRSQQQDLYLQALGKRENEPLVKSDGSQLVWFCCGGVQLAMTAGVAQQIMEARSYRDQELHDVASAGIASMELLTVAEIAKAVDDDTLVVWPEEYRSISSGTTIVGL